MVRLSFPAPSPTPLKGMLAVSVAFHLLVGFLALTAVSLHKNPLRLEPVAVVSLVGGGEFRREAAGPAPSSPQEEAPSKSAPREKSPPAKKPPSMPAPGDYAASKRKPAAPDTSSVAERLKEMRETRAGSESVREAVEGRRREAAARAAVRGVGERVARRIEGPPVSAAGAGDSGGGSQGTVRVSPELLEFYRKLEERVRESWVVPEALMRDAGKLLVEMRIVIEKDGRVSDARIEKGSGNVYFDDSVRRAIRKASPLPVPPERLRGGEDHYEVGFRFHGAGGGR